MIFIKKQEHTLISIAEWSILDYLATGKRKKLPDIFEIDLQLRSKRGVFVSVYVKRDLRGCMGTFSESVPLYKNVQQMALQAALEDDRFKPIKENESGNLKIEISVLSSRVKIEGPEKIEIGKHGVYLVHGISCATLLPRVAVEHNFTPVEFLECCAENKLGMSRNSWKEADLYVYEAVVIK